MPPKGSGFQEAMTAAEAAILAGYIEHCLSKENASARTQAKKRHYGYKIIAVLHEMGKTLDSAGYPDFAKVPGRLKNRNGEALTQNSRQSFVSQLKSMVSYIGKTRKISGEKSLFDDIQAGSPSKQNKEVLSPEEWETLLNAPMSAKERAYLAMLYDGYHRPGEPLTLKWSDLKIGEHGGIQYELAFKTAIKRTIVQKPDCTAILEAWRRECGHEYGDDAPVFPDRSGEHYSTLSFAVDLFDRLQKETGISGLVPSCIRNTAISHDVQDGRELTYICLRAWGEPYNDMINVYTKANSAKMQAEQQAKANGGEGVTIEHLKPREIKATKECPACHKKNAMAGAFCLYCGANLSGDKTGVVEKLTNENADLRAQVATITKNLDRLTKMFETEIALAGQPGQSEAEYYDGLRAVGYTVQPTPDGGLHVRKKKTA